MKIFKLFTVLLIAMLVSQQASGAITEFLPGSSHYEGHSYFNSSTLSGRIDFAVYDTDGANGDEFSNAGFGTAEGQGRYIYAYQVILESESTDIIDHFEILGIGEEALQEPLNDNISFTDDQTGEGISPEMCYIGFSETYGQLGIWEFNDDIEGGQHSWFLLLRSDQDWKPGAYTFNEAQDIQPPVPNPEPATLALFALGGGLAWLKERKRK